MAIVTKKFPYEIMIRFSEGASHQKNEVGAFEGAHFIERVRMFDDESGEIVGTPKGEETDKPKPLDEGQVTTLLGAPFVAFVKQIRDLQQRLDDTTKVADEAAEKAARDIADRDAAIADRDRLLAELTLVKEGFEGRIAAVRAALG